MSELIENLHLTSLLMLMLVVGFIKLRADMYIVGDTEKYIAVVILLISLVMSVSTAFILIWI